MKIRFQADADLSEDIVLGLIVSQLGSGLRYLSNRPTESVVRVIVLARRVLTSNASLTPIGTPMSVAVIQSGGRQGLANNISKTPPTYSAVLMPCRAALTLENLLEAKDWI